MGRDVIVVTSVIPALAEAEDDVLTAQLLLCILQQGDQAETGKERLPKINSHQYQEYSMNQRKSSAVKCSVCYQYIKAGDFRPTVLN